MGHKSAVSVSLHSAKDPTKQKVNQKAKIRTVKQFSFHWCLSESRGKQNSRGHKKGGGAGTAEEDRVEKAAPITLE